MKKGAVHAAEKPGHSPEMKRVLMRIEKGYLSKAKGHLSDFNRAFFRGEKEHL